MSTRSSPATTLAGTCTTSPWRKPASGSSSRDRRPKLARASSPTIEIAAHPSVVSITSASGSSADRRVATSRATSSVTGGAQSSRSSSSATRHARARPGTRSRSSAPASAEAVTTPIRARASSRTEPGPVGVVEGCPPDDAAAGEERDPAPRLALDAESHQGALERQRSHALERGLPDEPRLVHRDGPLQAELRRMVVGQRVLSEVEVTLLQPERVEGAQPEGLGALGAAGLEQRVVELGTARALVVELEPDLADEADPERTAGHIGDGDLGVPHMGEGHRAHLIVGQAFEDRPGARAREEDRPELGGLIEQMDVEVPAVDPVAEPCLHGRCASGGRAEVEAAVVQGGEETVV